MSKLEQYKYLGIVINDAIQKKAIRIFLGVHKFVSIDAINGDMGWTTSCERRKINMVRF